ncbi:unnamed protein product [Ambrosiozyma monospora]|uniref:Unnamed protein product n=1 Tax=Ambrosiozyma monospora TaxID=43982 RepID=A0ACB5SRU0_AMBMO|nr:unnamed protein product [Ambrosiozyma monospora]
MTDFTQKEKLPSDSHVLIIGGGTFGLSTALELLRNGHKNLTILDPYPIPSPLAAGNDVNKIFQLKVESHFYSDLAAESFKKWTTDEVYKPAFHDTGIVYAGHSEEAIESVLQRYEELKAEGSKEIELLESSEDFAKILKPLGGIEELSLDSSKRFKDWKGCFQKNTCGWTFASLALKRAAEECIKLGAKIVTDTAEELLFAEDGTCIGVRTFSGKAIKAKKTVIAAGANSIKLFDFKGQLLAKCWTVGHIKLTDDEIKALKGSPVVLNLDGGFYFEPDANGDLKFCNEFPGYINLAKIPSNAEITSVPIYKQAIPLEAEQYMREFLKETLPTLANRPFNVATICWCTDTPDRHFLFGDHPDHPGLVLGTGDSGKGFKYMPVVGDYLSKIVQYGDGILSEEKREAWKWRPETAVNRDIYDLQGRLGGSNLIKDLGSIKEWTEGSNPTK